MMADITQIILDNAFKNWKDCGLIGDGEAFFSHIIAAAEILRTDAIAQGAMDTAKRIDEIIVLAKELNK